MPRRLIRIISLILCFCFLWTQSGITQVLPQLSPALAQPLPLLRYLSVNQANPANYFNFLIDSSEFIVHSSQTKEELNSEAQKLIHYFFLGITLPSDAFWVNLKPAEADRITSDELSKTDLGRTLLEQDLLLKKDVAKYLHPYNPQGKLYWEKLYQTIGKEKAKKATITSSNRVWIVPDEAVVLETEDGALVAKSTLKVLLESEYLSLKEKRWNKEVEAKSEVKDEIKNLSESLMKEIILPAISQDINTSSSYGPLRQIYHCLILAEWFKRKVSRFTSEPVSQLTGEPVNPLTRSPASPYAPYIDSGLTQGLESQLPWEKQKIWQEYLKSYQEGEYKLQDSLFGLKRMYWSGGIVFGLGGGSGQTGQGGINDTGSSPLRIIEIEEWKEKPPGGPYSIVLTTGDSAALTTSNPLSEERKFPKQEITVFPAGPGNKPEPEAPSPAKKSLPALKSKSQEEGASLDKQTTGSPLEEKPASSAIEDSKEKSVFFRSVLDKLRGWLPFSPPDTETVKKSQKAFAYFDPSQDFSGVDLEHFIVAVNRLVEQDLPEELLQHVTKTLAIKLKPGEDAYEKIYQRVSEGSLSKEIIDLINALTYQNPRLSIEIIGQNKNPRRQGILEAVSNSLDALGLNIGQFGKGVKQIIDWLEPSGEDMIAVFTKEKDKAPYQLTILKDTKGQNYIQIRKIPLRTFQEAMRQPLEQGTMVKITAKNTIPLTDKELSNQQRNSQEGIAEEIHKRFPYITSVAITTQIGSQEPEKVNGFGTKEVIVSPKTTGLIPQDIAVGKFIQVKFSDHTIEIIDNGRGMNAEVISRMFVPKQGTKHPQALSGKASQGELAKVKVVQDTTLAHRVSFSRNGEVVVAVNIPQGIVKEATAQGGLSLDFGALLDVPESRDNIIIPLDLKPGEKTNFQLAVEQAISEIIHHLHLSNREKIRYINTLVIGLEELIKGNENYAYAVGTIRANTRKLLADIIAALRKEGFIILPHQQEFKQLAVPEDKKAIFINPHLFDWQGASNLKEIGGIVFPGLTLGGEKHLPLVLVPFTAESLKGILKYDRLWHTLSQEGRIPILKTDRFIALPGNLSGSQRVLTLMQKRIKGLTQEEEEELNSLLQFINILTASEVVTSYEIAAPRENIKLAPIDFARSKGEIDSEAIDAFLTQPPVVPQGRPPGQRERQIPPDANQRYVLLKNGDILEMETGNTFNLRGWDNIEQIEALGKGYYKITTDTAYHFAKIERGHTPAIFNVHKDAGNILFSPDKRFAYIQHRDGKIIPEIFNLETHYSYYLGSNFSTLATFHPHLFSGIPNPYFDLKFSKDSKYLTYLEQKREDVELVIIKIFSPEEVFTNKISLSAFFNGGKIIKRFRLREDLNIGDNFEYEINPFANVVFLRDKKTGEMSLIDLEDNANLVASGVKALHTDSTGAYTAIINAEGDEMLIYLHKARKTLTKRDAGGKSIIAVETKRKDGKAFHGAVLYGGKSSYFDENSTALFESEVLPKGEKEDYSEIFEENGRRGFRLKDWPTIFWDEGKGDPLQRLNQKGLYKHPHFDLLINNSDPDPQNPVALDPVSGKKYPYRGEIVQYKRIKKKPASQSSSSTASSSISAPAGDREGVLIFKADDGKLILKQEDGKTETIFDSTFFADMSHSNFAIGILQGEIWVFDLDDLTHFRLFSDPVFGQDFSDRYTSVSFDGEYLVVTNPKTGDVLYLNPKTPRQPIFVSTQAAPTSILTNQKPTDAPAKFIIQRIPSGEFFIWNLEKSELAPGVYDHIERINDSTFLAYQKNSAVIIKEGRIIHQSLPTEKVIAHTDRLVIFENNLGEKLQYLYDTETKKQFPHLVRKYYFSSSGRFFLFQFTPEELSYYDFNESRLKLIPQNGEYHDYLVHGRADVVIIKDMQGKYGLYSLEFGKELVKGADHIEIDSSGKIAIVKKEDWLYAIDLMGNLKIGTTALQKIIRVAANDRYVYFEGIYPSRSSFTQIFDIVTGHDISGTVLAVEARKILPRFWESYDLEKKTIWDREAGQQAKDWAISYPDNPPLPADKSLLLYGTTSLYIIQSQERFELSNLEINDWHTNSLFRDEKLYSLPGGKVWYKMKQNKEVRVVNLAFFYSDSYGFINQSKSFIMIQNEKGSTFLIASEGAVTDITQHIPSGFILTDVNGDYFVFVNPQTKEIRYLNPAGIKGPTPTQTPEISSEVSQKQSEALALWNNQILPQREEFITQARNAYQPFLDLIPEEHKGAIERLLKPLIEKLYQGQEKEIQQRYRSALEGKNLDLDTSLPFEQFKQRIGQIMQVLPQYLASETDVLLQEEYGLQKIFYLNLFGSLFEVVLNFDLRMDILDNRMLAVLSWGWKIDTQERIDTIPLIAEVLETLKQVTHHQIKLSELSKIVEFLSNASSLDNGKNISVVRGQIQKILNKKPQVKAKFLNQLHKTFKEINQDEIIAYLAKTGEPHKLKEARPFVVFLSQEVNELKKKGNFLPQGEDVADVPQAGVEISQLIKLEQQRPKKDEEDIVMDIDYLLTHINSPPPASEAQEAEILKNITVQGESGAYTREITQNSRDAIRDKKGELVVDFYLQKNEAGEEEYVEEAADNGSGALKEVALLIPKSTKQEAGQIELTGFFGTGKYTIFEGVDRLEMITKNQERGFMFTFTVVKDEAGSPKTIKLIGIRKITDERLNQGVTIRRIKKIDSTIPELDAMLAQRSWKTFTGLSQDEDFKIFFLDPQGNRQPLLVEKEVLSQNDFAGQRPADGQLINLGKLRIINTKDMPTQIIDKAGLRVSELKEEYLELIPLSLRKFIEELGIVIQIPLPLIRNRSAFEHENEYLGLIQKYVAMEFYKAIVYKTLTQTSPQFIFEGFPLDWETNDSYWKSIDLNDKNLVSLAERINKSEYDQIREQELKEILPKPQELDKEKKFLKVLLLLEVATDETKPASKVSLLLRRLAVQDRINAARAKEQADLLQKIGLTLGSLPSIVPYFQEKVYQAKEIDLIYEQIRNPEEYIIPENKYSLLERQLADLAFSIAKHFGIEQILLVDRRVRFAGAFTMYRGKHTILLTQSLVRVPEQEQGTVKSSVVDKTTDTITHELAHLLEKFMRQDYQGDLFEQGFVAHMADFTHDAVGTFAEAMKYVSAISLAKHLSYSASEAKDETNSSSSIAEVLKAGEVPSVLALNSDPDADSVSSPLIPERKEGGIDLSQIELTLKDEKFISSLNPAELKILRAAKALKDEWNSLSLLYVHEIMLLLKDELVKDLQNKDLLLDILRQLQIRESLDPQAFQFLNFLSSQKPDSEIKVANVFDTGGVSG